MSNLKPKMDRSYGMASITLRPWKGKIGMIRTVIDISHDIEQEVNKQLGYIRDSGKYKRRTVTMVSIELGQNYKL